MWQRIRARRWTLWAAAVAALLVVVLGVSYLVLSAQQGDISHPDVEFDTGRNAPAQPPSIPKPGRYPTDDGFSWPVFGRNEARTSALPMRQDLHPPYVRRWVFHASALLEFPPVLCGRSLYLLNGKGVLYSISRLTGKVRWKAALGSLAASSPACSDDAVYAVILKRSGASGTGRVAALDSRNGHIRWSRNLPSRAESSPLLYDGSVYFGTEDGTVYRLRATDGSVRWRYQAAGAVKGGLALDRGKLYVGDYGGGFQAIDALNGRRVWRQGTNGGPLGLTSGSFYSTPAIAFGRVYAGNTDGNVYSFSTRTGRLAWRTHTGAYVYSSPAVTDAGGAPTVYIGSYDRQLYALDARSGSVRWSQAAGGRVSGGIVAFGGLVFASTLEHSTSVFGARHGRRMWHFPKGAFNPGISDGRRLYLVGSSTLTMVSSRPQARDDHNALRVYTASRRARAKAQAAAAKAKRPARSAG
jgi:outer membrane protein assembly factor BamB